VSATASPFPAPATTGSSTASAMSAAIVPSKIPTTEAARKAVARLMCSHDLDGRRGGPHQALEPLDGPGEDHLVQRHGSQQLPLGIHDEDVWTRRRRKVLRRLTTSRTVASDRKVVIRGSINPPAPASR
jgi:hypothetical protein